LTDDGLSAGKAADLLVVDGERITLAVVAHPPRRLVMKAGRVTARGGTCVRPAP
jgi:cytosine deaminase